MDDAVKAALDTLKELLNQEDKAIRLAASQTILNYATNPNRADQ